MAHKSSLKKQLVRSTSAQINLFVDYMATNKDFANSLGEYSGVLGARNANAEWEALREQLKQHGADKTVLQWKQTWRDLKRKARRTVSENKVQMPVVSDVIFKVLETIGQDCSMQMHTAGSSAGEDCDWEIDSGENSLLEENEGDKTRNGEHIDIDSNKSSEPEVDDVADKNSVVEVIVPLPQIKDVYSAESPSKPLHDPLWEMGDSPATRLPRLPRLAPKPLSRTVPALAFSSYPQLSPPTERSPRSPTVTRRKQILMTRRRKSLNMFQQASHDYVSLEQRRLTMEEERDRRLHEREMERLKLELQRIEVQRNHNELLQHLVNVAQNAYELLQQKLQ